MKTYSLPDITKCLQWQERGRQRIPGLTQLLSKRPDQFAPGVWPCYFQKAKGTEIWDLDGNHYIDMSISGIGAVILGYGDPDVDAAVINAIGQGTFSTLNCPEEVELAQLLCGLHPWAQMVRYGRGGGEMMMMAVRIARAHTRRDKIAFCGYHGWHDWYLSANLAADNALEGHLLPGLLPNGVPAGLKGTALPFYYNRIEELEAIVGRHRNELAAIVMEPVRSEEPRKGFLEGVRRLADESGAVLIFDEVSSGFRMNTGGVHLLYGVIPDMAVFAKGMSNGYPMGAVIGKGHVMKAAQDTFISSTYWTDRIGPTAAIATITKHQKLDVGPHLTAMGRLVQEGWKNAAGKHGLNIRVYGMPPISHFSFEDPQGAAMMTLFVQTMLARGFLACNRYYANDMHTPPLVQQYCEAVDEAFGFIKEAYDRREILKHLLGPVAQPGFCRLA